MLISTMISAALNQRATESSPRTQTKIYDKFITFSGVQLNILTFRIKKKNKSIAQIRTENLYCL